jgi:hypothetical protein
MGDCFLYGFPIPPREEQNQRRFVPPDLPNIPIPSTHRKSLLDAAFDRAIEALKSPDCAGLFNLEGQGPPPSAMLTALRDGTSFGTIVYGQLAELRVATTMRSFGLSIDESGQITQTLQVIITLNNDGNGFWATEGVLQNAATLLHEMGHAYQMLFGNNSTALIRESLNPNSDIQGVLSAINSGIVWNKCFK